MKYLPFVLVLIVSMLNSCSEEANQFTLGIDVQASFNQDHVKVLVDGKEMINHTLQTNNLLGVCIEGRALFAIRAGTHKIEVRVNNTVTKTEKFSMDKNLYIGINYDSQSLQINLIYSDTPFGYD